MRRRSRCAPHTSGTLCSIIARLLLLPSLDQSVSLLRIIEVALLSATTEASTSSMQKRPRNRAMSERAQKLSGPTSSSYTLHIMGGLFFPKCSLLIKGDFQLYLKYISCIQNTLISNSITVKTVGILFFINFKAQNSPLGSY